MVEYDYKHCFDNGHQWVKDTLTGGSDTAPFVAQMSEFALAYTGNDGREFYSNPEVFVGRNAENLRRARFRPLPI